MKLYMLAVVLVSLSLTSSLPMARRQAQAGLKSCNQWDNPTTVDMCKVSGAIYATADEAAAAAPATYQEIAAAQPGVYSEPFKCDKICPPGEVPGCQKSNKYTGGTGPVVIAVPVLGGWLSMTCYFGVTREEGCRICIPDPT
jgi:hypothetical protein